MWLCVAGNCIRAEGAEALAKVLPHCDNLEGRGARGRLGKEERRGGRGVWGVCV